MHPLSTSTNIPSYQTDCLKGTEFPQLTSVYLIKEESWQCWFGKANKMFFTNYFKCNLKGRNPVRSDMLLFFTIFISGIDINLRDKIVTLKHDCLQVRSSHITEGAWCYGRNVLSTFFFLHLMMTPREGKHSIYQLLVTIL